MRAHLTSAHEILEAEQRLPILGYWIGIAIHGSWAMAVYPACHGCIRISLFAAKESSELVPLGTEVIVYESAKTR